MKMSTFSLCFSYLLVTSLKPEKSLPLECSGSIEHDMVENFKVKKEGFFDREFTSLEMYQISQGDIVGIVGIISGDYL